MKACLSILFVCLINSAFATNYYFSDVSGDDNRTSAQATNSSTPWQSLDKLNSFFSNLQPGDSVLFKRGETFYGSVIVNKSGASGNPIVIGAYGSGNKPIITSLVTLSGWSANSSQSGVYDCSANSAFPSQLNLVVVNDVEQGIGRYPNSDDANKGYLTIDSHVTNQSITDKQLPSSPNWKGAEVVIRTSHWTLDRSLITSQSGSTIYYNAGSGAYNARDKYGYFIQNDLRTLDQFGEWYYNPSTKKLSMYFGSKDPSSYAVQAATINNLVYSNNKTNVLFDNITFKGANSDAIYINSGSNVAVQNCDIIFSGNSAVNATGSNFRIENSTVLNSNNNGIDAGRGSSPIIRNNIVRNSFFLAGMGANNSGTGIGIKNGNRGIVEYNQVINSGYAGIMLGGDYAVVKNNFIDSFCILKDDAGGIYTANGGNSINVGRQIIGNILFHAVGATEGTDNISGFVSAQGIYMDDNINGVEITGNTIANCSKGMFLHNSYNMVVKNNTLYDNALAQLYMKHDDLGVPLRNHTITNNIFFAKTSSQLAASFSSTVSDIASIGSLDNNYYARPIDDKLEIETITNLYKSNQVKTRMDLATWKSKYGKDPNSDGSPVTISGNPDDYLRLVYNASQASKTIPLNGNYIDVTGKKFSNSIVLQPYASAVLIKTGGSSSSTTVSLTSPASNSTFDAPATVYISATANSTNGINKVDFYSGSTLLYTDYDAPYEYSWQNVQAGNYSITAVATDANGNPTTSDVVPISVGTDNNSAPAVTLTSPTSDTTYTNSSTIYLSAVANNLNGISKVQFYNGTTLLRNEYYDPYEYSWKNVPDGSYTITAVATDDNGNQTTSTSVVITVATGVNRGVSDTTGLNNVVSGINDSIEAIPPKNNLSNPDGSKLVDFTLFPNPAKNRLNIAFNKLQSYQKANMLIQNASGITIKKVPIVISGTNAGIDISSLSAGVYVITIYNDKFTISKRFVKIEN